MGESRSRDGVVVGSLRERLDGNFILLTMGGIEGCHFLLERAYLQRIARRMRPQADRDLAARPC